jgi:uncharacterized membrane protein
MSPKEGCFYVGVIAGLVIGVTGAHSMGWNKLIGLLIGAVLGMGLGYVCERTYSTMFANKDDGPRNPDDDQRQF